MQQQKQTSHAAGKVYAAPALYKDYNKATTDFLTKNYPAAGLWKIESKFKTPKDTVVVNPTASSDGKFAADIEYATSACDGSVKLTVTPEALDNLKATFTFNRNGHKCETVLHKKAGCDYDFELSHETAVLAGGRFSMNEKITKQRVYLGLGVDVAPNCQVGTEGTYDIKAKKCAWGVGCRYAVKGVEVAVRTEALNTYVTSASLPYTASVAGTTLKMSFAAQTVCGKGRGVDATIGLQTGCPLFPSNTLKARVNKNKDWAVSYLMKVADNWVISASVDKSMKLGLLLTHS